MATTDYNSLIDAILEDITTSDSSLELSKIQNKLIATIACHSSIRAGDILERNQAEKLITDLLNCDTPYSCPHGRPIMWELSKSDIAKNFERNK
jgi:DNA mismatch repair protein MutL